MIGSSILMRGMTYPFHLNSSTTHTSLDAEDSVYVVLRSLSLNTHSFRLLISTSSDRSHSITTMVTGYVPVTSARTTSQPLLSNYLSLINSCIQFLRLGRQSLRNAKDFGPMWCNGS